MSTCMDCFACGAIQPTTATMGVQYHPAAPGLRSSSPIVPWCLMNALFCFSVALQFEQRISCSLLATAITTILSVGIFAILSHVRGTQSAKTSSLDFYSRIAQAITLGTGRLKRVRPTQKGVIPLAKREPPQQTIYSQILLKVFSNTSEQTVNITTRAARGGH